MATCTSGGAYTAAFTNTSEKAIATLMVLFSGVLWSQLIGVLCSVASNMSPMKQAVRPPDQISPSGLPPPPPSFFWTGWGLAPAAGPASVLTGTRPTCLR